MQRPEPKIKMLVEQYDLLVKLMRGKPESPANIAAKKVLVHGVKIRDAIEDSGIKRDSVYKAIKRYSDAHDQAVEAFRENHLPDVFDLIVSLTRGNPKAPTTLAARSIILYGKAINQMQLAELTPNALPQAVSRYRAAIEEISKHYSMHSSLGETINPPKNPESARKD